MKTPHAILIAAVIIAVCIMIRPAQAELTGPYQLMHHSNTTAWPGIFRLNTSTGDLTYCYIAGENTVLTCTGAK